MKLKRLFKRKVGLGILALQLLVSIMFVVILISLGMIPDKYIMIAGIVEVLLLAAMVCVQITKGHVHIPGKVVSALLSVILLVGCYYFYNVYSTSDYVTGKNKKFDDVNVIVMKDNIAETISDVQNKVFGVVDNDGIDKTDETVGQINSNLNTTIETRTYSDNDALVQALYDHEIEVIIMVDSFRSLVEASHPTFSEDTKVLETYQHETELSNKGIEDVTEMPFSVYLSGIDTYGEIAKTSRSDVNIIATVNPKTKMVLLTSTPRDYYVPTSVSGGMEDKLTHAGLYGIDCSVQTLEMLYDVEINYYAKVNFTGFMTVVDALGGVTVHSDYNFTGEEGYSFTKGNNTVNGKEALDFVRERHSFASGDLQRNKNQQYLIKAVIEKLSSPAILSGFNQILEGVQDSVITNLGRNEISSLIKMQLGDGASWTIVMNGVSGEGGKRATYSNQSKKGYVMYVDEEKVNNASNLINDVINGKVFTQEDIKK